MLWVLGWCPKHPYHGTAQARKRYFCIPRMGVFEVDYAKKYAVTYGVALQTPIPLCTTSEKMCFCTPRMGGFKCTMPLGWCPKHPYHGTAQARKRYFCIPRMGVFEVDYAKKYAVTYGVALQTPIPLCTTSEKMCFCIPRMGGFKCTMPLGWCRKHPYHGTAQARKSGRCLTPMPLHTTSQKRSFENT